MIFFSCLAVYFVLGFVYKMFRQGKQVSYVCACQLWAIVVPRELTWRLLGKGLDAVPNIESWRGLYAMVADGATFCRERVGDTKPPSGNLSVGPQSSSSAAAVNEPDDGATKYDEL
jgi:hypothetical protein